MCAAFTPSCRSTLKPRLSMKRASWVLRAISFLAVYAVLPACSSIEPDTAPPGVIRLTAGEIAISAPGDLNHAPPKALQLAPALEWTQVELPHALPRTVVPNQGD